MTRRPSQFMIGWWLVFGAGMASLGAAMSGFEHENPVTLIGIGNPVIRVLGIWALAVAVQAAAWRAWARIRNRS